MAKREIPTLVKVISILYYVMAGFLLILGLAFLFAGGYLSSILQSIPILNILGLLGSAMFVFAGIVMILFGIFDFFIGKGLWNTKNWARILVIVLAILGILASLSSLTTVFGIVDLLFNLGVGGYLLFSKEAKKAFEK